MLVCWLHGLCRRDVRRGTHAEGAMAANTATPYGLPSSEPTLLPIRACHVVISVNCLWSRTRQFIQYVATEHLRRVYLPNADLAATLQSCPVASLSYITLAVALLRWKERNEWLLTMEGHRGNHWKGKRAGPVSKRESAIEFFLWF